MSAATTGVVMLSGAIGGAIYGAIGAAVSDSARSYPVLKGALVASAVSAFTSLIFEAGIEAARSLPAPTGVSGVSRSSYRPRFP